MTKIEIIIPDDLIEKIKSTGREESEVVCEALRKLFAVGGMVDMSLRLTLLETKVSDIQSQLDEHRLSSKDDKIVDFDGELKSRHSGKKPLLDCVSYHSLEDVSAVPPPKKEKTIKPSKSVTALSEGFDIKI